MLYRPTDKNGDMRPITRRTELLNGAQAVSAACASFLRLHRGEWWEDDTIGSPILNMLITGFKQDLTPQAISQALTQYLQTLAFLRMVKNVKYTFDKTSKIATYTFDIVTTDGLEISQGVTLDGVL